MAAAQRGRLRSGMKSYPLVRSGALVQVLVGENKLPIVQVLGIGRNYMDHAKEQGLAPPDSIMVFTKSIGSVCLSGEEIVIPPICRDAAFGGDQTDFEGELAVIIGTPARDVSKDRALGHVLGYCVGNDVSARWWQKQGSGGQFFRGKSFDTFCPLGPQVTPAAMVKDPAKLRVTTLVNGETMQDASTGDMSFDVPTLISELSRGMTLVAGTVILTGTPSGVGMARKPPVWLKQGDKVEISIRGEGVELGTLVNRVRVE
jgi:2-keto-4-pentenoate hydratase/2-oxohepta-3-ene-1,7-dioic acid hydratase in catechol pathway